MSQKAVLLHANVKRATEVDISVAQPSGEPGGIDPKNYINNLPGADPDHLLVADCPFSHLIDTPVVLIYDASGKGNPNPCASRLTTNTENGLEIDIKGDAIVMYSTPNANFSVAQWEELDNVIYDELLEYFGQGLKPQKKDLDRLVTEFKHGRYKYRSYNEDEDVNKDDGTVNDNGKNENLPGWG